MLNTAKKLAEIVAECKVKWQENLIGAREKGENPRDSFAVVERFAHYVASERMLIAYLEEQPHTQAKMVRGDWDNSAACAMAKRLIEESLPWQTYCASLDK